ncbi:MAG: hypothetical protein ACFB0E_16060 [Leptolyngbyaceae cyanobacterium]
MTQIANVIARWMIFSNGVNINSFYPRNAMGDEQPAVVSVSLLPVGYLREWRLLAYFRLAKAVVFINQFSGNPFKAVRQCDAARSMTSNSNRICGANFEF